MKKLILSLLIVLSITCVINAQVPQAINYQAVVRNNTGDVIKNQLVQFKLSITEGLNGTVVYSEIQQATTNLLGLVNLSIGTGNTLVGNMPTINWISGQKYLKIEVDVTGGSNYILMGSQGFVSVPYSFYAEKANIANSVANQWQFNINGINYNIGRVGIGTATPNFGLHIERDGDGFSSSAFDQRSLLYLLNTSTNTASNTNIKVGSVGTIGTTNITNFTPNYSVVGGYANCGRLSNTGSGLILQAQQQIRLKTGNNTPERMIINSDGNIGIGTTTPNFGLHIERDGDGFSSSAYDPRSLLYLLNTSTNTASNTNFKVASVGTTSTTNITNFPTIYSVVAGYANCGMLSNTGAGLILQAQQQIRFKTGNNTPERMIINADGNVGIGTITPKSKVEIANGDVYMSDATKGIILKSPNGNCWRVTIDDTGNFIRMAIVCPN